MGPKTLKLSSQLPSCSTIEELKVQNKAIQGLQYGYDDSYDLQSVEEKTNCKRPCTYNVFSLANNVQQLRTPNFTKVLLLLESNTILEKKQAYVYPWTSLVAEFGGTLGLFVGFSFLMIWDFFDEVVSKIRAFVKRRFK